MKMRSFIFLSVLPFILLGTTASLRAQQQETGPAARRVIIFVWDGLRADDLTPEIAPNYFALARSGVVFADHHAVYPTFTMMNSASIATGVYPGVHGFYGNVVYAPSAKGKNAKGADIDFSAPAFIEDFGVVEAVRDSYRGRLTLVSTMLQTAQAKGLTTAAIGKFGAAFIQDYKRGGIILDEDAAINDCPQWIISNVTGHRAVIVILGNDDVRRLLPAEPAQFFDDPAQDLVVHPGRVD